MNNLTEAQKAKAWDYFKDFVERLKNKNDPKAKPVIAAYELGIRSVEFLVVEVDKIIGEKNG